MYHLQRKFWILGIAAVLAGILFTVSFGKVYFGPYKEESKGMFSYWALEQAKAAKTDEDWLRFMFAYNNQDYHYRYYLMQYRGETCSDTDIKWQKQRKFFQEHHLNF
jgi:hypothetical protein